MAPRTWGAGVNGLWISFEGIEGCGKTTQMTALADRLSADELAVTTTREPGGTNIGSQLRALLLDRRQSIRPETELLLYAADRVEHHAQVILPALEQGQIVLCDRHLDATIAYQGFARGLPVRWIREIHAEGILKLRPQRTLWLDLAVEESLPRARERTEREAPEESRFEDHELEFHRQVRAGYASLAETEPERIIRIDASGDHSIVADRIDLALKDILQDYRS